MNEPHMIAGIERDDDGLRVVAPAVGQWSSIPTSGTVLGPGSRIGMLRRLNRRYRLVMPHDAGGRIVSGLPATRVSAVGYGDTLFRLASLDVGDSAPAVAAGADADDGDLGAGVRAIVAPTDGVFYRRPAPDAAPYTAAGATLTTGAPVGLVEVMKTFNQIVYGGPGWPERVEVVEVRADDGDEVRAGDALVLVREP